MISAILCDVAASIPTVRDAAASAPDRFYLPELDSLRFVAFLAVFACHAAIYTGHDGWVARTGGFGVDLLFTLSAFLLAALETPK